MRSLSLFGLLFCSCVIQSQTLRIGLAEDPDVLDPTMARTFVGRIVFSALCDKLFDLDEKLNVVPQLATAYEWSGENRTLTLKLRPGVTFHDGEKLDAAAVKFSLERHKNMPGSNRRGDLAPVASVDVVDAHTVRLNLSAPFAPLLAVLTDRAGMIVSPKAAQAAALGRDGRVGEAFELSLDRDALVKVAMDGEAVTGNQWVSPANRYYARNVPIPKRDVAKAKALLAAAGAANPSFTLMTPTTSDAQRIAQVVQAMAKEAGFDIKIQSTEFSTSLNMADKGEFEAYALAWSGRADPDGNLHIFNACKAPLNTSGYCKKEVDELIGKARTTLDPAQRARFYEQIAAELAKDRPIVYLFHRNWLWAHAAKLSGLRTVPDGLVRVRGQRMN